MIHMHIGTWSCECWVTGSNLKLEKDQPETIYSTAARSSSPGWSAGISGSFSPCKSFFSSWLLFPLSSTLLQHFLYIPSWLLFCHCFDKYVDLTSKPHHNNPDKSHKQFCTVPLHFLPLLHFLSSGFLFVSKPVILSYVLWHKYAIERHIRSFKTISKLINNCQVRGKAERAWATLKAHQRPEESEARG